MRILFAGLLALSLVTRAGWAEDLAEIEVEGSTVTAKIELAPALEADLTITFEQVVGLHANAAALGLSVTSIDPTGFDLLGRLPDTQLISIPAEFPVLLAIEPPADGPLSFSGVVSIELHTHNLTYTVACPLRLFAAEEGGSFYDITNTMGTGSYRVGASKGGFSEFLIVADLRAATTAIDQKFARLQTILDHNCGDVDGTVLATLQGHVDTAWSWYVAGDLLSAKAEIDEFIAAVKANSGTAIPATWRSAGDLVNVGGLLRQEASTLRFSLSLAASS